MCGIAGSVNPKTAFELYSLNLSRGYYSSGNYNIKKNGNTLCKQLGIFNKEQSDVCEYSLYHSRGPTVETTHFVEDDNHPFIYRNWVVAHNGIIKNYIDLAKEYFSLDTSIIRTDSSIIPRLLSIMDIKDVLELIKGTFALWMYNTVDKKIYITRNSSTLYANKDTGDFSSSFFEGSVLLPEGILYEIEGFKKILQVASYKSKSPYFII